MTKSSDSKKPKEKEPEVDFSQISPDDIARQFLETPPKPKRNKRSKDNKQKN
jgi:hypothetical protein